MIKFFIIVALVSLFVIYNANSKIFQNMRKHIFGLSIYYVVFSFLILIIDSNKIKFSDLNDYFTSFLLIIGMIISFIIFLTNRNILPSKKVIDFINKTPDYILFSHTFKKYLLSLNEAPQPKDRELTPPLIKSPSKTLLGAKYSILSKK